MRALADDEMFLGRFAVNAPEGRVVVIDNELDERMLRRWLRDQGVRNVERVAVLPLRGRVGTFDLLDDDTRARWATKLREVDASVVLFDCLRPVLDALGLSEDKDAGRPRALRRAAVGGGRHGGRRGAPHGAPGGAVPG